MHFACFFLIAPQPLGAFGVDTRDALRPKILASQSAHMQRRAMAGREAGKDVQSRAGVVWLQNPPPGILDQTRPRWKHEESVRRLLNVDESPAQKAAAEWKIAQARNYKKLMSKFKKTFQQKQRKRPASMNPVAVKYAHRVARKNSRDEKAAKVKASREAKAAKAMTRNAAEAKQLREELQLANQKMQEAAAEKYALYAASKRNWRDVSARQAAKLGADNEAMIRFRRAARATAARARAAAAAGGGEGGARA
jgi:hypothetical protein